MLQNITLFFIASRFGFAITQNLNGVAGFFQRHFAGTDNLRMVSIILLLLAFILFLFLIVILYIKSLLSFIKNDMSPDASASKEKKISQELELEKEMEKELERELEKAQQQKQNEQLLLKQQMEEERLRRNTAEKELEKRSRRKAESDLTKAKNSFQFAPNAAVFGRQAPSIGSRGNASAIEFDWKKGRSGELDETAAGINPFQYQPAQKPLDSMSGLIINMLGRNIDAGKIAQTVKAKCGDLASEEEIIQTIDSIKNFISLCNNGKFENLPNADELPLPDEALFQLAQGDSSYCLAMMEALMNNNIDKCQQMKMPQKRDIVFTETSNHACTFGSLANLSDVQLATGAFELAIELSPKNVNAWSRAADTYAKAGSDSKAIWAYQNVLNMGDEDIYPHQIANANKQLSQYYYEQGDTVKAAKLYNSSNDYYAAIGINQDLTGREQEIINIIEAKQSEDLPDTIKRLLNIKAQRQRGYM